jgi:predicted phosphoribosyltransferase
MFSNREDAGLRLARWLKGRRLRDPLVLAVPRGGAVIGAVLAEELGAELDVVLDRKLRATAQPELALGAVSESGDVYLIAAGRASAGELEEYLEAERAHQLAEIGRRRRLFRRGRPPAPVAVRSVIVTDDGIATGSTMIAALDMVRALAPRELIVAVPVIAPQQVAAFRRLCDWLVFLACPSPFYAVGQFYADFNEVSDEQVAYLLRERAADRAARNATRSPAAAPP